MAESSALARQQVANARKSVDAELDRLGPAARATFDIPAKVRRHPVETLGAAGGAAFLLLGGPRRVARAVERRVLPGRANRPPTLLPKEVDQAIDRLPPDDQEQVRAHLERDFATYLEKTHPREQPNPRQAFWKTYDMLISSVGTAASRQLVRRLFEPPEKPSDKDK